MTKSRVSSPGYGYSSTIQSERQGLMSTSQFDDSGDALIEMDILPPRWADISDEVTEMLSDIAFKGQELEKLHKQHVLPGFNDEDVKRQEEIKIERLTQEITKRFHECQKAIQRVDILVRDSKAQFGISKGEEIMAKNVQISLASKVQEASAAFRKRQSAYLKKVRGAFGMNATIDGTSINAITDPSTQGTDGEITYSQLALQKYNESNDAAINQREREINEIAQGIIELAEIFQDLQRMVIDQGTMLDRIDYNIERMAVDVKGADSQLKIASSYQKRGTRRKAILLLILLVIGMFIILMLKSRNHSQNDEKDSS
ncbi:hypothetical protein Golomagni_02079 [Golovinomyces magnicellulatus]|nr:hypothetical protein Golomagni_02079 [Golovinomyces magnicellulatus]